MLRHVDRRDDAAVLRALLAAFPDRLARRREPGSRKGVMVGGRGVRLAPTSGGGRPELFLCVDVDAGQAEALVRQASGVQRDWLPAGQLRVRHRAVAFDEQAEKVTARRRHAASTTWSSRKAQGTLPDDAEVARVLAAAAAGRLERVLPAADSPAGQFLLARPLPAASGCRS